MTIGDNNAAIGIKIPIGDNNTAIGLKIPIIPDKCKIMLDLYRFLVVYLSMEKGETRWLLGEYCPTLYER